MRDPFYDREPCTAGHYCCRRTKAHRHDETAYDCRGCWNLPDDVEVTV